ncbi:MAG: glycosyltransferase, partial [Candidatus Thorarchaeota archaeon]
MNNYILVTPARNEEKNIEHLIESINSQSLKPKLWIIVNDNSTDSTQEIVQKCSKIHTWIKILNNNEKSEYMGINYSKVCILGFDYALNLAKQKGLNYEYIGLLDADIELPKEYFKELIKRMNNNKQLGITSGSIYSKTKNGLITDTLRTDLPRGAARVWRKKCFIETGGYKLTRAPDSVSNIKAKLAGWKIERFLDLKAIQTRETSSGIGLWKGYLEKGEDSYILNLN